ncbi:MAG: glycosyltransferase family 2 protein [Bacteroidetes bacterium]|nr:glycosyltransferase family 2 protein [Bacteroidota bacterium]
MKVTGFSFIKNAILYQYPIKEALKSILPICDEVIVAVGNSEDNTRDLVASINPQKIKIVDSVWDENLKEGGQVLAAETDKAFREIAPDTDWCIYIQGDEVFHEKDYAEINAAMELYKDNMDIDGFLFKYLHFYGSFDFTGASSTWYRNEIRIIRNNKKIYSYRDAQGFRKNDHEKLVVVPLDASVYHYGWVREPGVMQAKCDHFGTYWNGGEKTVSNVKSREDVFDYMKIDALKKFIGTHPAVMQERIHNMNWKFNYDPSFNRIKMKDRFKNILEKMTGKRFFDYQNYKIYKA